MLGHLPDKVVSFDRRLDLSLVMINGEMCHRSFMMTGAVSRNYG